MNSQTVVENMSTNQKKKAIQKIKEKERKKEKKKIVRAMFLFEN